MSTPRVVVPDDRLPKAKSHPIRLAAAALATARDLHAKAEEALDAAEMSTADQLRAWEKDRAEAVARIAAGEAVTVAARPSEADAADRVETARLALEEAKRNEAKAAADYDRAVLDNLADVLPSMTEQMHKDADDAATAVETARAALRRALSSRALALDVRASEAYAALTATGAKDGQRLVIDAEMTAKRPGGIPFGRTVPYSVAEKARDAAATAFGIAPPVSEIAAHLDAVAEALTAISTEDAAQPWPVQAIPKDVATALGLDVPPPPPPAPLETREEFDARYRRAINLREPIPRLPEHLGGLV